MPTASECVTSNGGEPHTIVPKAQDGQVAMVSCFVPASWHSRSGQRRTWTASALPLLKIPTTSGRLTSLDFSWNGFRLRSLIARIGKAGGWFQVLSAYNPREFSQYDSLLSMYSTTVSQLVIYLFAIPSLPHPPHVCTRRQISCLRYKFTLPSEGK